MPITIQLVPNKVPILIKLHKLVLLLKPNKGIINNPLIIEEDFMFYFKLTFHQKLGKQYGLLPSIYRKIFINFSDILIS